MEASEEILASLGLTHTEARIYLTGLGDDALSIPMLVSKTRIKRPTLYHAMGTLAQKGLVTRKERGSKTLYSFASPESIRGLVELERELLDERARKLNDLIPLLSQHTKKNPEERLDIVQYEGIEGMKMVMDIAFYCRSKKWDIIAPYKNFLREYDREYAERYLRARKHYGVTSRTLWESGMRDGRKLSQDEKQDRNPRLMPSIMHGKFKSMMVLFDDKIAIFSSFEKHSAILITSKELHGMFSAMFAGIWEISEPY
ncbi:MAG TPA: helix-turn-helix domain-containing protein [Candidatus Paceibacterota bacterium]